MLKLLDYARFAKTLNIDVRYVCENINDGENDFEVEGYRFIHEDSIAEIMQEELSSDEYVLGCFNAGFLSEAIGVDSDVIEAMQEANAFGAIGKLVLSLDKIEEVQELAVTWDGFGQYFSHYDGSEESVGEYLVFRVN